MAIDVSSNSVTLDVTRAQGTHGRIAVSYVTTMLPERYTDNDLVINRAIENRDYTTAQGILVFEPGKVGTVRLFDSFMAFGYKQWRN